MGEAVDVLVVGCGTAGAAVARACARRGLSVVAVDSKPLDQAGARWVNGVPGWAFDDGGLSRPTGAECHGVGHGFHMVAGFGPGKLTVPAAELYEVDMRHLVARLQRDAVQAGAALSGEEAVRQWEPDAGGAFVRTTHRTVEAKVVVDAAGLVGAPFHPPPPVPRTELCVAAQEVRAVTDVQAARCFFTDHGVPAGDTLVFTGVAGGYSIVNVRLDETHEDGPSLGILTGSIPGLGHPSGAALLRRFADEHAWVGPTRFGGSRAIPLVAPLARLDEGPLVRIGDAARQVFAAHGSGIGAQLVGAAMLADVLATGGRPFDWSVRWQRRFGGQFCGSVAFARFSRQLGPEALRELFASGLMAPSAAGRTLAQEPLGVDARDLPHLPGMLRGMLRAPGWLRRLGPVGAQMARLEWHHRRYPDRPEAVAGWARRRDALLAG